jgi:hypothetical protein
MLPTPLGAARDAIVLKQAYLPPGGNESEEKKFLQV